MDVGGFDGLSAVAPTTSIWITVLDSGSINRRGSDGQGLRIITSSRSPSVRDVWEGTATYDLLGPVGATATVEAILQTRAGVELQATSFDIHLPKLAASLPGLLREHRISALHRHIERAEGLVVRLSMKRVGTVELRSEREFQALRWLLNTSDVSRTALLSNNTDLEPDARFHPLAQLAAPEAIAWSDPFELPPLGGMLIATAGDLRTSLIVPSDLKAMMSSAHNSRIVPRGPRTEGQLQSFIRLARLWREAESHGDSMSSYVQVRALRDLSSAITRIIVPERWGFMDLRLSTRQQDFDQSEAEVALIRSNVPKALVQSTRGVVREMSQVSTRKRLDALGRWLLNHHLDTPSELSVRRFSFLLMVAATEPGQLFNVSTPQELKSLLVHVLKQPHQWALARFITFAIEDLDLDGYEGATFGGWLWQ